MASRKRAGAKKKSAQTKIHENKTPRTKNADKAPPPAAALPPAPLPAPKIQPPGRFWRKVRGICRFLQFAARYALGLPFRRWSIPFALARWLVRSFDGGTKNFSKEAAAWQLLNVLLHEFVAKKDDFAKRRQSCREAVDVLIRLLDSVPRNAPFGRFVALWREFAPRTPDDFAARDRAFFMSREGRLLERVDCDVMTEALCLDEDGYQAMCHLHRAAVRHLRNLLERAGIADDPFIAPFLQNEEAWGNFIMLVRQTLLTRLKTYVVNMRLFCRSKEELRGAMRHLTMAHKCIGDVEALDRKPANRDRCRQILEYLADRLNVAAAEVYLFCKWLDCRALAADDAPAAKRAKPAAKGMGAPHPADRESPRRQRWPTLSAQKCGRFAFTWTKAPRTTVGEKLVVKDVDNNKTFKNISGPAVFDALEAFMREYKSRYHRVQMPGEKSGWRANFTKDAARFASMEMEPWRKGLKLLEPGVSPSDRPHCYRILPDDQPLRNTKSSKKSKPPKR